MDNKKHVGSPSSELSSSFTCDLFGAKESSNPSAPTGIFSSIFPPPSTVVGRNSTTELIGSLQKQFSRSQAWGKENSDDMTNREGVRDCKSHIERSSIFQERVEPHPLSSSLYYGGQESMYVHSSAAQTEGSYSNIKENEGEADSSGNSSQGASRGNWWQGSLYY